VEFAIENIDPIKKSAISNLNSGDAVMVLQNGLKLGTLDSEIIYSEDSLTANGYIIINGIIENNTLKMLNGLSISANDEIEIATERVQITIKIVSIQ
jgi:hypothetical protein